jgi:hypothetical protein
MNIIKNMNERIGMSRREKRKKLGGKKEKQ